IDRQRVGACLHARACRYLKLSADQCASTNITSPSFRLLARGEEVQARTLTCTMTQLQAYFGDTGVLRKAFCNVSVWTCRKKRAMALGEVKVALAIMAAVAVAFAAYQGASVFAPLVLALFIVGITWPLPRWLQSRMPKLIALAITLIVIVAVGVAFASLVAWGFGRVGHALMSDAARYQALYDNLVTWLDSHGISVAGLWAEHFNVRWLLNKAQYV